MRRPTLSISNAALPLLVIGVVVALLGIIGCTHPVPEVEATPSPQPRSKPYLNMPPTAAGLLPQHLSQVGAFADLQSLRPRAGLRPYDVNVSFWSDGAGKQRWISLPAGSAITFSADEWKFPPGTVFVKHFERAATPTSPPRRLETRVLVCDANGGVYGATYKWRADNSDADLVEEPETLHFDGDDTWYVPGRRDCLTCHTAASGGVLGVKTRQLNRPLPGSGENQLIAWNRDGYFGNSAAGLDSNQLPRLAPADEASRPIADRARSYLDANCAQCHRPGGVAGYFDARYTQPLREQNLIDGPVLINLGLDHAKVISPADPWRSIALVRVETSDRTRMPPLAHQKIDRGGAALLRQWIASLPGTPVLPPPSISPRGGEFRNEAAVSLADADATATIHYTLDGSLPTKSSPIYSTPLRLTDPATLRARAFRDDFKPSVAVQETFIVSP